MTHTAEQSPASLRDEFDFAIGDELRGERATLGRSLLDVQRDLRIKAAYIAAIESTDPSVFPNPAFVPGYVRAYARYLGLDPEAVYARFCAESGFKSPAGAGVGGSKVAVARADRGRRRGVAAGSSFAMAFPLAEPRWRGLGVGLGALPVSAIGSLLVLVGLAGGLGYGGWTVLQNIQRVQFAPIEVAPVALAVVEALATPDAPQLPEPELNELARPVAATALTELYRRQESEVPILAPRDGPIAAIDPDRVGLLARGGAARPAAAVTVAATPATPGVADPAAVSAAAAGPAILDPESDAPQLNATVEPAALTVVAERAAWIRVYLADKTVIFERILETGETYSPPPDIAQPLIWAGNSGSVYVRLGATLRGPLGSGTRTVRDIVLDPAAIAERFGEVAEVPDVISRAFDPSIEAAAVRLQ